MICTELLQLINCPYCLIIVPTAKEMIECGVLSKFYRYFCGFKATALLSCLILCNTFEFS